jgi:hypothetical protein
MYMKLEPSTRKGKRFMVTFENGKTIHFGMLGGKTYIDEGDKAKRTAYLQRHQKNEDWNDPYSAGAVSRWILWGDSKDLEANHMAFMKKFKVK